ncbi:XrtA/PEP-CTERM system-associated ATPase [Telmatospirillum sp.]|uniref:XrtA/PEP-CTERM system-associated ATPase n=1 Tax=Telmatospirillum sp. TaxID=2079197 RepID=UPI002850F672|nr:XrtA/PEP-CTERM system-associated ATPase [Telmatospirillum sp.]MDR3439948.1 XrtA-associated ATPase [Telmatospirillum sp.]
MYNEFYGLSASPFQLTPDPRFFFESSVHRKAMAHLFFGLEQREGFIVITGDIGAGKTTILGHLLATLDAQEYVAAKIVSPHLGGDDMLRAVASAFNLQFANLDKASLLRRIEDFLVDNHRQGRRTLLLVDEAQNVPPPALEELRMLSNFQVGAKVPLQSFLLAQPQFRRTLASVDLEQFRQRIIASYHLGPMGAAETSEYVQHRLAVVGWKNDPEFTEEALADIFLHTGGVPRKINTLCSRIMLFCFLDELHKVDRDVVRNVAEDLARETNQVVDTSDGRSGGVMLSPSQGGENVQETAGVAHRIDKLEKTVIRHGRALRYFSSVIEKNLLEGTSGDSDPG